MKSRSGHNSTKIGFMIFFYRDVTAFNQVPLTSLFAVTQHHEKRCHPPSPMCGVVIEQPINICGVVFWLLTNHFVA